MRYLMSEIEWAENRLQRSHLRAHAQRYALQESNPFLLPNFSALLFIRIIQRGRELKQIRFELKSRDRI